MPSAPDTTHALYTLLDSNLPTGGFVASSGLESYAKHGFLLPSRPYGLADPPDLTSARRAAGREWGTKTSAPQSAAPLGPSKAGPAMADFARAEVENFEASTGWYLSESWGVVVRALAHGAERGGERGEEAGSLDGAIADLVALDETHETTLLSHVARRASKAQGVALLTLYARGLGPPPGFDEEQADTYPNGGANGDATRERAREKERERQREERAQSLVAGYKRAVRRGAPGHLAVCFGAVAAALGMDLHTAQHLYLFTHTRSLLSSGVRLNVVGPYLSTQLLAHPMRRIIDDAMAADVGGYPPDPAAPAAVADPASAGGAGEAGDGVNGGMRADRHGTNGRAEDAEGQGEGEGVDAWAWADDAERGPATTWPLGEILAARHDLQHSRIFNS